MTTPTLIFNQPYPPDLEQSIRLALEQGLVSDKAQARACGAQPGSIRDRWDRIADRLALTYGHRDRAEVVCALFRSRAVEYLMLALCMYTATLAGGSDIIRPARPSRAPVVVVLRTNRPTPDAWATTGLDRVRWAA